jgi:hypothetical protein
MRLLLARSGRVGVALAGVILSAGTAAAGEQGGWLSRIYLGTPRNPNTVATTSGGIPGARGLAPGYGYYPQYSSDWPTLREALAQYGWFGRRGGPCAGSPAPACGPQP